MDFDNRGSLWLLPALPVILAFLAFWGWTAKKEIGEALSLDRPALRRKQIEKYVAAFVLGALLTVAMALPKIASSAIAPPEKEIEIALLVDVSGSMAARKEIHSASRLARTQSMLVEIVARLEDMGQPKVSLHGFTNIARSHVPFVGKKDYGYLNESIRNVLDIYSAPGQGSVLGQPILDLASKFSAGTSVKLILLFSDGEPFVGLTQSFRAVERKSMEQAIQKAVQEGITVIAIGVGEREGARIPLLDANGVFAGDYAQLNGVDFVTYLEEEQLKEIAERTGGKYFTEADLGGVVPYLRDGLASARSSSLPREVKVYQSIAPLFILAALPVWIFLVRRHLMD